MPSSSKTIVITGAGSGIGRACARAFLEQGWSVALLGRRETPLKETAQGFENALISPCDVTKEAEVERAFDQAFDTWGRIDALFNNAGIFPAGALIDEIAAEDWRAALDVNVTGAFLCARAAFAIMRRQTPQGGRIINNGSISAYAPRPGSMCYTASKHAITGLTKTLSLDGRPFDIACGQIDIGNAESEMTEGMAKGVPQANGALAAEPLMEIGDVARSVLYMASLPLNANVQFMTVMATKMPYIGRG